MGGASRNDKRRRQEAANARLRAAGITPTKKAPPLRGGGNRTTLIVVGVVLVVAVVAVVGVLLTRGGSGETVTPTYTASASDEGIVTAGNGPIVVDVYEDYLCPICERFEERYGQELTQALNDGQVTVRYHSVSILDNRTDPEGYSTRAANAALCSVAAGIFPAYHGALFDNQPSEGSAGLPDEQLVSLGTGLGADASFGECVTSGANTDAVAAATSNAEADPVAAPGGQFGTPTVVVGGAKVDLADTSWLQNAIAAG